MIKSICLPVDGSVYTDAQLKHAIALAQSFGATVRVLSIIDVRIFEWAAVMGTEGFVPIIPSTVYKEETRKILQQKASAVLDKCASILKENNVEFTTELAQGSPADIISEQARVVDMLILGARGEFAKWKRGLVGATADAVIRQWPKPTLVTPKEYAPVRRILCAYDGSDSANRALQLVGYCASQLGVPVIVLMVNDKRERRQRILDEAGEYLKPYRLQVELLGVSGSPEKKIISQAEQHDANMIILGAFGHSRIRKAIVGSTIEQIIRNTQLPVLLSK